MAAPRKSVLGPGRVLKWAWRWLNVMLWAASVLGVAAMGALLGGYYYLSRDLPLIHSLHSYRPPIITEVYSDDGTLIAEFARQRRRIVSEKDIPDMVKQTFLSAEDHRFLAHSGVDWAGVAAAFWGGVRNPGQMRGASTISMQVARTFFLTHERTFERKAKEAILAVRIEQELSKEDILFLYLNQVDMGRSCHGLGEAAYYYFGKTPAELTQGEAAMLAGLLPAPSRFNPVSDFDKARRRQKIVLFDKMVRETGVLTWEEAEAAAAEPIKVLGQLGPRGKDAPFFIEHVRRQLIGRYGEDMVYHDGLKVFTTVNVHADRVANEAVRRRIIGKNGVDKAMGYRGPLADGPPDDKSIEDILAGREREFRKLWAREKRQEARVAGLAEAPGNRFDELMENAPDPVPLKIGKYYRAVVTGVSDSAVEVQVAVGNSKGVIRGKDMAWAGRYERKLIPPVKLGAPSEILAPENIILVKVIGRERSGVYRMSLEQEPAVEGGLISLAVKSGHVKALCGGVDYAKSQFIRPVQSMRQPGSAFKPIVYAAAMDDPRGRFTPASILIDTPIIFDTETRNPSCPHEVMLWEKYKPRNYNSTWTGKQSVRQALAKSINTIAVRIAWNLCLPDVIDYAKKLGIKSDLDYLPCLALGCSEVTLEEIAAAYNVFATGGRRLEPVYIARVYDRDGNLLEFEERIEESEQKQPHKSGSYWSSFDDDDEFFEEDIYYDSPRPFFSPDRPGHFYTEQPTAPDDLGEPTWEEYLAEIGEDGRDWLPPLSGPAHGESVVSPQTAYIITHLLTSVVKQGTATRAAALRRPVAGKTGTTNEYRDALFIGYSPELLAAVWVGSDNYSYSMGKGMSGGKAALPVWIDYMGEMLKDREKVDFQAPSGISWVTVDGATGLRPAECTKSEDIITEVFKRGTEPTEFSSCTDETEFRDTDYLRILDR